jgi:diaminopimelate epimerase
MHGLGNDFVVLDLFEQAFTANSQRIQAIADRHRGIGCDQVLLVGPSTVADVACQIFNADGSEAEQCGNGLRCVARFVHEKQRIRKSAFTIATKAGLIPVVIHSYDKIQVNMGKPDYSLKPLQVVVDAIPLTLTTLSLGNPHAILRVEKIKELPVAQMATIISSNSAFSQGINLGFMEVRDRNHIQLRTYERGVGETLACGSNACAAVIAGLLNGWLDSTVAVELPYGNLLVEWPDPQQAVLLTGPATRVFSGVF